MIGRTHVALRRGQRADDEPRCLNSLPTLLAHGIPTGPVTLAIVGNVFRQRVQRKVRGSKAKIVEERLLGMFLRMLPERANSMVDNCLRAVVAFASLDGRQLLVVFEVNSRIEEPSLILQQVGTMKTV